MIIIQREWIKYCSVSLAQQTRYIDPMLVQCWTSVVDGDPTLDQHWIDVSCLLGYHHLNVPFLFLEKFYTPPLTLSVWGPSLTSDFDGPRTERSFKRYNGRY